MVSRRDPWVRGTARITYPTVRWECEAVGRAFYDAYGFAVVGERLDEKTGLRLLRLRLDC